MHMLRLMLRENRCDPWCSVGLGAIPRLDIGAYVRSKELSQQCTYVGSAEAAEQCANMDNNQVCQASLAQGPCKDLLFDNTADVWRI